MKGKGAAPLGRASGPASEGRRRGGRRGPSDWACLGFHPQPPGTCGTLAHWLSAPYRSGMSPLKLQCVG